MTNAVRDPKALSANLRTGPRPQARPQAQPKTAPAPQAPASRLAAQPPVKPPAPAPAAAPTTPPTTVRTQAPVLAPATASVHPRPSSLPDDPQLLHFWAREERRVVVHLRFGAVLHGKLLQLAKYALLIHEDGAEAPSVVMKHACDLVRLAGEEE